MCEIEHLQGRYSSRSSLSTPMSINTSVAVSTPAKTAYVSAPCSIPHVNHRRVNDMSLPSAQFAVNIGKSLHSDSYKLPSAWRKLEYKCLKTQLAFRRQLRHLFSLLAIYNSPCECKHSKKIQPVSCFHMMDDLLREFLKLLLFEALHPHPEPTHKNTLSTLPFPAPEPRGEKDTFTCSSAKFPRWSRKHQTSGFMLLCLTKTRCVESITFPSCARTSRNTVKQFHNNASHCFVDREGFFHIFWAVGGDRWVKLLHDYYTPMNGFASGNCFKKNGEKGKDPDSVTFAHEDNNSNNCYCTNSNCFEQTPNFCSDDFRHVSNSGPTVSFGEMQTFSQHLCLAWEGNVVNVFLIETN